MEPGKQGEIRETEVLEMEKVTGEVRSMAEAEEIFDKIMNMDEPPDGTKEYQAPKEPDIFLGTSAFTS